MNNYLKRDDLINSVDSNKIWSKSMDISEVMELLDKLEQEMSKYDYESDKNFLMDGRRNGLRLSIENRVSSDHERVEERVLESLFNLWEFINNEYHVISSESLDRLHLSSEEMEKMCNEYTQSGIICLEEKDIILEMIQMIKRIS